MRTQEKPVVEKLLFEKFFSEEESFDIKKWRLHENQSFDRIQSSIVQNVTHILNTTNTLTVDTYLEKKLIFMDFGVPDFVTLYQTNGISHGKIEKCIQRALLTVEPRLLEAEAKIEKINNRPIITVKGKINKQEGSFFKIVYENLK